MGCSTSSVVPLGESDIDDECGIKVRVNPSTPDQIIRKDYNKMVKNKPPPLAFEVPIFDDEKSEGSLIRKHPPKRFRKFDEEPELTHDTLDERQREAEKRRREILSQRIMSAKTRPRPKPLIHSEAFNQDEDNFEKNM